MWKQALWIAVQNLVFSAWWCPSDFRATLLRWFGGSIAEGVFIRHRVRVLWPWKLTIGADSWVGEEAWLLNLEPITIGANACVSQGAFLCTGSHDRHHETFEFDNGPIEIGDGAWVATQALVLRGVSIGDDAVVGARATVTRHVPAGGMVRANERW